MEIITLLSLFLLFILSLTLAGWIFSRHLRALLRHKQEDQSFLLIQQQIDQLRLHFGQVLDSRAQSIEQQLGQLLGHVHARLKENAEVLQMNQQIGQKLVIAGSDQEELVEPRSLGSQTG